MKRLCSRQILHKQIDVDPQNQNMESFQRPFHHHLICFHFLTDYTLQSNFLKSRFHFDQIFHHLVTAMWVITTLVALTWMKRERMIILRRRNHQNSGTHVWLLYCAAADFSKSGEEFGMATFRNLLVTFPSLIITFGCDCKWCGAFVWWENKNVASLNSHELRNWLKNFEASPRDRLIGFMIFVIFSSLRSHEALNYTHVNKSVYTRARAIRLGP